MAKKDVAPQEEILVDEVEQKEETLENEGVVDGFAPPVKKDKNTQLNDLGEHRAGGVGGCGDHRDRHHR